MLMLCVCFSRLCRCSPCEKLSDAPKSFVLSRSAWWYLPALFVSSYGLFRRGSQVYVVQGLLTVDQSVPLLPVGAFI